MANTYKVKVELTTLAQSEDEARGNVSRLISPANLNGGSVTKTEVEEVYNDKGEEQSKKDQSANEKAAEEQFKDQEFLVESQVPDEIIIKDPNTGTSKLIKNPLKEKQLEEVRKKQGKSEKDKFDPQMNPQDARVFTGGQVDNKSSEGGFVRGSENITEQDAAMYRKVPSANKQREQSTSSTSESDDSSSTRKPTETGKTQVRKSY